MSLLLKNLSKFKLITFDVTGTLLKFSVVPSTQYLKIAKEFGYTDVNEEKLVQNFRIKFKTMVKSFPNFGKHSELNWQEWWAKLVVDIFNSLDSKFQDEDIKEIAKILIEKYKTSECWTKYDGADNLLLKIKENNKTIGIISNFDPRLEIIIQNMNFPTFDFILNSYDAGFEKPDPRIFNQALKIKYPCSSSEALHIGNSPDLDYLASRNAGWSSILISNGNDDWQKFGGINAKQVFNSLEDLLFHLENDINFSKTLNS